MDPQIEELKALVRQNTALAEETRDMVHSMRNASRVGRAAKLVWLGLLAAVSIASFIYLAPYLAEMQTFIQKAQEAIQQAQQIGQQLQGGGQR